MFNRYPLQIAVGIFVFFILTVSQTTLGLETATPKSVVLTIYQDGVANVDYRVAVDQDAARMTFTLIGNNYENVVVTGSGGRPLDFRLDQNTITVDTVGDPLVTVTYTSHGVATVSGALWTIVLDSPIPFSMIFPEGAAIVSVNQPPLDANTEKTTTLTMPAGHSEISYTLAVGAGSQSLSGSPNPVNPQTSQLPASPSTSQPSNSLIQPQQQGYLQFISALVGIIVVATIVGVIVSRRRKQQSTNK